MKKQAHPKLALLGDGSVKIAVDPEWFPEVDCVVPLVGDSYKASEGIRSGDLALISFDRKPKPGELVLADTPRDGRRIMRLVAAEAPFLRSDNRTIHDVDLGEEGLRIIGTVVDTMRNPPILMRTDGTGDLVQVPKRKV